jgi:hypothetical protein
MGIDSKDPDNFNNQPMSKKFSWIIFNTSIIVTIIAILIAIFTFYSLNKKPF